MLASCCDRDTLAQEVRARLLSAQLDNHGKEIEGMFVEM